MKKNRYYIKLAGSLIAFLGILFFADLQPGKPEVTQTFAIAVLMAIWWITEIVPLAITSLLPVLLFPVFGIVNGKAISSAYFNDVIFLFIGGFLLALAMQRWELHRRIALRILMFTGVSAGKILLGFMLSTAFLSMWISNTATAMMMIPIAISILNQMEKNMDQKSFHKFSSGMLLGIAYSASIGGIATIVGTPPNLAFIKIFAITFPDAPEISFGQWMLFGLPLSVIMLSILWVYLYFVFFRNKKSAAHSVNPDTFKKQYRKLGTMSYEEKIVFGAFLLFAGLLIFRSDILLGDFKIPGWANLFKEPHFLNDGTVAIAIAIFMFMIPSRKIKGEHIMTWKTAHDIPWNIILLFGGGFALAMGFVSSGLSEWIGNQLSSVLHLHPLIIVISIITVMIFLTEVTSNTATTQMLLPILASLAISTGINPLIFMIPATIAASMAFMLPVATPPNAIVFGTNRLRIATMAKTGFVLNLVGIVIISVITWFYGTYIFDIHLGVMPGWAVF